MIEWNSRKADGTPKKQLEVIRLSALCWLARIPLAEGLASTVAEAKGLTNRWRREYDTLMSQPAQQGSTPLLAA